MIPEGCNMCEPLRKLCDFCGTDDHIAPWVETGDTEYIIHLSEQVGIEVSRDEKGDWRVFSEGFNGLACDGGRYASAEEAMIDAQKHTAYWLTVWVRNLTGEKP